MKKNKLKKLTLTALFASIMCILSPFSIHLGTLPISLATFSVYFAALFLPMSASIGAVVGYVVLGTVGLPVFAGFLGGLSRIIAPSGGFIIGYIPCVLMTSFLARIVDTRETGRFVRVILYALSALAGGIVCYLVGTVQFCFVTGMSVNEAIAVCVLPFIPFEILKITAAAYLASLMRTKRVLNVFRI
ncbi:MAG: biotin transporter BioY [Ruminococcaceae bacterium]|nr:biotin transporter BioY [Oscillospiraceae bacterium]